MDTSDRFTYMPAFEVLVGWEYELHWRWMGKVKRMIAKCYKYPITCVISEVGVL